MAAPPTSASEPALPDATSGSGAVPGAGGADSQPGSAGAAGTGGTAGGPDADAEPSVDAFGITQLYPSKPDGAVWDSRHWALSGPYSIDGRADPNDPFGISGRRGTGTLNVTADGELVFGGSQPRIYFYPTDRGPWQNVELTVYYQRVADDATAWGGLVIGMRSGPEGHGEQPCDAHTYYSRLRHDGAVDFEKELMHSPSSTQQRVAPELVWPADGQLPFGTWIGWKYVIYNVEGGTAVKLEAYRDLSGGVDGGQWELLNETTDVGGWSCQTSCAEHAPSNGQSDMIQLQGGVTFIRNTGVTEARYKWLTIREIAPHP